MRGYIGKGSVYAVRQLSAPSGSHPNGQAVSVKARVHAYLEANPSLEQLSVNQVLLVLKDAGVQAGRTTVADVLHERKPVNPDNSE